jgi:hypothetical protein
MVQATEWDIISAFMRVLSLSDTSIILSHFFLACSLPMSLHFIGRACMGSDMRTLSFAVRRELPSLESGWILRL